MKQSCFPPAQRLSVLTDWLLACKPVFFLVFLTYSQFQGPMVQALLPLHPSMNLSSQVHAKIRENPCPPKKERVKPADAKRWSTPKLTYEQKKKNLKEKLEALAE